MNLLVLHIGTHKTGTSAIQATLARATAKLREHGIHYLEAGRGERLAHHPLAWAVRGRRNTSIAIWKDVPAELARSDARVNILSAEGFWFEDPARIRELLEYDGDVKIVAFLRRQDAFLQSLYKQTVSSGRRADFPTWLNELSYRGDYLSVIDRWADAFGHDAIVVRPYERDGRTIDAVDDFFAAIGLDPKDVIGDGKRGAYNPSPRAELLYFLRAFNQLNLAIDYEKFFYSVIQKNKAYVRSQDLFTYEQSLEIMARYAESNRALAERYWKGEGPLFGEPVRRDPPAMWTPDDPEFFQLAVDVLDSVVNMVAPEGPGTGKVRKKQRHSAPAP